MKVAIPISDFKLCEHFGHCERYAIVDVDERTNKIISTTYVLPPAHKPGLYPKWLAEKGARVVIAGSMGKRARKMFYKYNIKTIIGAQSQTPEKAIEVYLNDVLSKGPDFYEH